MALLCFHRFPKISRHNIMVIKRLNIKENDTYISPMLQENYKLNEVKKLSLKDKLIFFWTGIKYQKIDRGLHSYTVEESKKYTKTGVEFEAIIPKWTWYYEERFVGNVREYASTRLKVIRIINEN